MYHPHIYDNNNDDNNSEIDISERHRGSACVLQIKYVTGH